MVWQLCRGSWSSSFPWLPVSSALSPHCCCGASGCRTHCFLGGNGVGRRVSLLPLLPPGATDLSTKIWLSVMHVITWLFVVPQIARIMGDTEPGRHAEREVILT